jgi:hypothetical protein
MERIAEALGTTHKTISKDLDGFVPEVQTPRPKAADPRAHGSRRKIRTLPPPHRRGDLIAFLFGANGEIYSRRSSLSPAVRRAQPSIAFRPAAVIFTRNTVA